MITVNQAVESAIKFAIDIASMKTKYTISDSKSEQSTLFPLEIIGIT